MGSVGGGVWKTINGGNSWFPLKDNMENLSISSLAIDPINHNVIYAGTGEGFFNSDALRGEGIFKSTDAGTSWNSLPSSLNSNFYFVNRLAIDKTTSTLWVATRNGLYASSDGGNTLTGVLTGENTNCTDVKVAYTNPTTIYASFGLQNDFTVYISNDMGNNFHEGYSSQTTKMGRTELAVSQSNPLVAYLSSMDLQTDKVGMMRVTTDGGNNWSPVTIPGGNDTYTSDQAWYNNALAVDPNNDQTLYAAGLALYRSDDRGNSWTKLTEWYSQNKYPYVHADNHVIAFDPNNGNTIYLGNDGGIYKSDDKGISWKDLNNNLFITQFYYGAVDPKENIFYGGAQDNGTLKSTNGGTNWTEILGGDGGAVEVDYQNTNTIYMEYVKLTFFRSLDGGITYQKKMNGIPTLSGYEWNGTSDRCEFISPFTMDPNDPNTIVAGTYKVYKTTDGANNWSSISDDLTGDGTGPTGSKVSALAIAKANSNVIYAGCSNGLVQVTTDNGNTWNLRNNGLPGAYLRRIAINPEDPATAVVVYSGYLDGSKVYLTNNYGSSWTNISGDLPNVPVNSVLINPVDIKNIIIGTDLGIFSTSNGGVNWILENNGLPNVAVDDLDYRASDSKIFASTHGRGMFFSYWNTSATAVNIDNSLPKSFDLSQNFPNPFNPTTQIKYQLPSPQNVRIVVYDINGRVVKELVNSFKNAGVYYVTWDGRNENGSQTASGLYLYTIQAGNFQKTMKMILLK
ncbi:MAG: FlgD immunoglobulin-like domain containing protein [Bacteroidota bacterium]|nr:FlgD immunoglobulin-like domain containing protein [Bacteroidota bacterium]